VSAVGLLLLSPSFFAFSIPFLASWLALAFLLTFLVLLAFASLASSSLALALVFFALALALPKPAARRREALRAGNRG
jgi:hypothetical protein